ncbi:MAG: hypothetical protein IPM07_09945 [Anaerolineales bacterium]|nr:hypothetical protein [Anaerolineales bacterium]
MNSAHLTSLSGLFKMTSNSPRPRLWLLLGLMLLTVALSGCTMQPILAGPLRQAPLPTDQGPIIAIAPIAAASGETVSVSGAGWQPEEVIFINLEGLRDEEAVQATLATGAADAEGRFYLAFVGAAGLLLAGGGRSSDRRLFAPERAIGSRALWPAYGG